MPTGPASHRLTLTIICLVVTAAVVALHLNEWLFEGAERSSRDWLLTNSAARHSPASPRLIVLGIDEATRKLDALFADDFEKSATLRLMKQGSPWKREVYADIIDRLADAGASAILFDIVFPEEKPGDDAFRAALLRHGDKVVIGSNLVDKRQILPAPLLQPPPGGFSWIGFVNVIPDPDGLVRHIHYRTSLLEYFGIAAKGGDGAQELLSLDARGLEKAGLSNRIPPGHRPVMCRSTEEIAPHSLVDIFVEAQWNAPPYNGGSLFRDKIVLIGETERASEDRIQTPYGSTFGVNIHVNALNAALNGDFVSETSMADDVALIAGSGLLAWILGAWIRRPLLRLLALAVSMFIYYEIAQNLANNYDLVPSLLSPLLTLTSSGIVWSAWEQVLDRLERQRTRRALDRYVGHDVASEVMDNPQTYFNTLGGVRKEITILFSDIRGFTTLTETADPHALVTQLNEYFGVMVDIVFAHEGTLDKFIGDAVMATWGSLGGGDPSTNATNAVTAALEMIQGLDRLNADWKQRGILPWKVGIGINHGEPITGNIGAAGKFERFDLTVVGDAVNLASRLEGVTKTYHIELCIGESVAALVRDQFILRSVDLIIVKGKTRPVEIFTVLGKRDATEPPSWLARHEEAMRLYRTGDFATAEKTWREVLAQAPGDGLAETFIARCVDLQADPPTPPWTGVYEMKSK